MTYSITDFQAKQINVGVFSTLMVPGHVAVLELDNGDRLFVSRLEEEDYWAVDAQFRANGFPVFSNGEGARISKIRTLNHDHPATLELNRLAELAR